MFKIPERNRIRTGHLATLSTDGNNGAFKLRGDIVDPPRSPDILCIASDGIGWEHVSVSVAYPDNAPRRCPTWAEMVRVKNTFWDPEDCVVQFHPPQSTYRNCHPYTLHLWRQIGMDPPMPDPDMVAPA